MFILDIVWSLLDAWKNGKINAKNTLSKKVQNKTKTNNKWLSILKNCETKIENNNIKSAFSINNEIFNFTSFKLAFEETKMYSQNPIFAKIKQNPAIAL